MSNNRYDAKTDLESLRRMLNLRLHWAGKENTSRSSLISRIIKSGWAPPDHISPHQTVWQDMVLDCNPPVESTKPNISPVARAAWKELITNPEFYLIKADKGGKLVMWRRTDYRKEALRQLLDPATYQQLPKEQADTCYTQLQTRKTNVIRSLYKARCISASEQTRLLGQKYEIPAIYFLPKVHKAKRADTNTFAGRPIIAATKGCLKALDEYLAALTSHILAEIPGSLKDTKDLINELEKLPPFVNATLFSGDVESLYPSIPWDEGIDAATRFYTLKYPSIIEKLDREGLLPPPSPSLFREILELVIKHNYFHFQNELWFHQTSGTAMGCSISVYFANTLMYYRTKSLIDRPPSELKFFFRYIDDIIGIWVGNPERIRDIFCNVVDEHIKLTFVIGGSSLEALDLRLTLHDNGKITTGLFRKPTDGHQFVHWGSNHPTHLKRSLPYSQLIRIKRNCSVNTEFEKEAQTLLDRFRLRNYPKRILNAALNKVRLLERKTLLVPSLRKPNGNNRINLVTTYHRDWATKLRNTIRVHYPKLRNNWKGKPEDNPLPVETPRIAFKIARKLGSFLGPVFKQGERS